jgi:hypothetical protein
VIRLIKRTGRITTYLSNFLFSDVDWKIANSIPSVIWNRMINNTILYNGFAKGLMLIGLALALRSSRKMKSKKVNAENIQVFIRIFTNEVITHININSFDDWILIWRIRRLCE